MLVEHYQEIPKEDANYYKYVHFLQQYTFVIFFIKHEHRKGIQLLKTTLQGQLLDFSKDLLSSEDTLLRLVSKIESNGFGVWKDSICMGRGSI